MGARGPRPGGGVARRWVGCEEGRAAARQGAELAEEKTRASASGWFAAEGDNCIRGWCRDRHRPDLRLEVAVFIDTKRIAAVPADRIVPRLEEGDGRHGFACAIPARYFDGREHAVRVEIVTDGYRGTALKTKQPAFVLEPEALAPKALLHRLDRHGLHGLITGPSGLREEVDLWLDGARLDADAVTAEWIAPERQVMPFRIAPARGTPLDLLGHAVAVRYPGAPEEENGTLGALIELSVSPFNDGRHQVLLGPGIDLPDGFVIPAEVRADTGAGPPLATLRLAFVRNRAIFALDAQVPDRLRLRLLGDGGRPIGAEAMFPRLGVPRRLLPNGDLSRWGTDGPDGFEAHRPMTRGFRAFPPGLKAQLRLSGTVLETTLDAADGETPILSQPVLPIGMAGAAPSIGLALIARASAPTWLSLRLIDGEGGTAAALEVTVGPRWRHEHLAVTLAAPIAGGRIELVARAPEGEEPAFLEVAGLHCGAPDVGGFADEAPAPSRALTPADTNLVANPALDRWPAGLAIEERSRRFPAAAGWTVDNPGLARVQVAALPAPGAPGRYALALEAGRSAQPIRLEIALEADALAGAGELVFQARLGGTTRVGSIERLMLVARAAHGDAPIGRETVVARIARRVALTRDWQEHRFVFVGTPAEEAGVDLATGFGVARRFAIAIEVTGPIALQLAGVDLRLAPVPAAAAAPAPLAFEDRTITAQLEVLRGLEAWGTPRVVRPAVRPAAAARAPDRWAWQGALPGTVEVAVCVHDAPDETLGCLASLAAAGGVPHTVRVIDDASAEDTRQRIAAFVAERPWMSLDPNPRHLGYTASANRAVAGSRADWVVLLNSDTVVSPGWLEGLLEVGASDERAGAVGPVSNAATYQSLPELHDATGRWAINPLPPGFSPGAMAAQVAELSERAFPEVPLLNGFCTAIRRAAFDAVGGFDERAFPHGYGEENDLCLRLRRAGWRLRVADHVYVFHHKSRSFGPERRVELSKAGDKALRTLHPDVDFAALGRGFATVPALHALRGKVRALYPAPVLADLPGEAA